MEKELIFHILGLEETKDEEKISDAYRTALKSVNPEDDPEGFKRLRQAYEEGIAFARKKENEGEVKEKNEVDLWIDRVEAFYLDVLSRYKVEKWREVLSDPVCDELDTALEARDKFVRFLMDHIRIPHSVWKLVDEIFSLREDREELEQKFPDDFLNFMFYYIENETFMPYELLEYRSLDGENVNGDGYIDAYLGIKRRIDEGESEGLLQELDDLEAFDLYHPYEDVERIRLMEKEGKTAESLELVRKLTSKYGFDFYLWITAAQALWSGGEKEEANKFCQEILSREPEHYMAKYWSGRYCLEKEEYFKARDLFLELLQVNPRSDELTAYLETANEKLIVEIREALEKGETYHELSGQKLWLRLGWCLFQNEKLEEAEAIAENVDPAGEEEYEYCNLFSRIKYAMEKYEESLPLLKRRLELTEKATTDSKEDEKIRSRKGACYYMLAGCYQALKQQEETENFLHMAIEAEEDTGDRLDYMRYLASVLLQAGKFEKVVDVCDQIVNEDEGYYPAYVIRQEAFYEMKRAQQVVNDYHSAVNIYPGYYKPYLFAAEVFFYYGQYEDGKNVIDRARENEVKFSPRMKLFEAKILRNLAENNEDRKVPHQLLDELFTELDGEDCDIEDKSEVEYEKGLLYWDEDEFDQALDHLQKAIDQNDERLQYRLIRGNVFLEMKKYQLALENYQKAEPSYKNSPELYYNRALCYEGMDKADLAAENFLKVEELEPGYRKTYEKLSDYYRDRYDTYCCREDFEKAIDYISKQLAIRESTYYLVCRGLIYSDAMELELAIKDYEKALEYSPEDSIVWNNLSCCYRSLKNYDKALECLEKAVELGKEKERLPYRNMASCYWDLREFDKAFAWYKKALELWPDYAFLWKKMGDSYYDIGEFDKALECYEHTKDRSDHYSDISDVWMKRGDAKKAIAWCKEGIQNAPSGKEAQYYSDLGDLYMEMLMDYEKAISCYEKALARELEPSQRFYYEAYLARCYVMSGQKKEAKIHGQAALDELEKSGRTIENHLGFKAYGTARMSNIAWCYLAIGETEKGEQLLWDMQTARPCKDCVFKGCFESWLYLGRYYESLGETKKALEYLEKAHEINPFSQEAIRAKEYILNH